MMTNNLYGDNRAEDYCFSTWQEVSPEKNQRIDDVFSIEGIGIFFQKAGKKLDFEKSGFDTKGQSGFDTSGFDTQITSKDRQDKGLPETMVGKRKGILIVSSETKPSNQYKKTRIKSKHPNKKVFSGTHYEHDGKFYEVMTRSDDGKRVYSVFSEIVDRIIEQFNIAFQIHGRLFVQHIVLSTEHYTPDNSNMTDFRKAITLMLKRKYKATRLAYVWSREIETSKQQHYHLFLVVDGQKLCFGEGLRKEVSAMIKRSDYFTKATMAGFHQVETVADLDSAIFHATYVAKTRGKGYRSEQAKDYSTSRLKP